MLYATGLYLYGYVRICLLPLFQSVSQGGSALANITSEDSNNSQN